MEQQKFVLSTYSDKLENCQSVANLNVLVDEKLVETSQNEDNSRASCKKVNPDLSRETETRPARTLVRWPSDPQLISRSFSLSETKQTPNDFIKNGRDYTCTFRTNLAKTNSLITNQNQRISKESCEAFFSKWKLASSKDSDSNPLSTTADQQARSHRNRRKLLKTNKICSYTE